MKLETFWKKREKLMQEANDLLEEINKDRTITTSFSFRDVFNVLLLDKLDSIERSLKKLNN